MIGLLALTLAATFFGAAIYINLAEHPARLQLDSAAAVAQWKPAYERGYAMQATLAVLSGAAGTAAWLAQGDVLWLAGAIAILANWPFTLLAIMPVNRELKAAATNAGDAHALLERWGRLHGVRSALGLLTTGLYMVASAS